MMSKAVNNISLYIYLSIYLSVCVCVCVCVCVWREEEFPFLMNKNIYKI